MSAPVIARPFAAFIDAIRSIFGYRVAGPVDYLARYPGRVVAQSGDLSTIDVLLDLDTDGNPRRMPSPSKVSIRLGVPGVTVEVKNTARCMVGFEQGDPDRPYIADWEQGAVVTITNIGASSYVAINGTDHPLPKFDTFEAALSSCLLSISTGLASGTSGSPVAQQLVALAAIQIAISNFRTALGNGTYDSSLGKNG